MAETRASKSNPNGQLGRRNSSRRRQGYPGSRELWGGVW